MQSQVEHVAGRNIVWIEQELAVWAARERITTREDRERGQRLELMQQLACLLASCSSDRLASCRKSVTQTPHPLADGADHGANVEQPKLAAARVDGVTVASERGPDRYVQPAAELVDALQVPGR